MRPKSKCVKKIVNKFHTALQTNYINTYKYKLNSTKNIKLIYITYINKGNWIGDKGRVTWGELMLYCLPVLEDVKNSFSLLFWSSYRPYTSCNEKKNSRVQKKYWNNMAFLTGFNRDYRTDFRKHWPIDLLRNKTLASLLPKQPTFIYRRAPIVRSKMSPNIYKPLKKISTFLDSTVFFHCERCKACRKAKITKKKIVLYILGYW